jgi:hypothetical protein
MVSACLSCHSTAAIMVSSFKEKPTWCTNILSIFCQPLHFSVVSRPIMRRYNRVYTTLVVIILFRWLSVVLAGSIQQNIRFCLLMMGLDTPETCGCWRNILRISCASSWFFFTRLYRDARSTKHKTKNMVSSLAGVRAVLGRPSFTTAAKATLNVSRSSLCNHQNTLYEGRWQ